MINMRDVESVLEKCTLSELKEDLAGLKRMEPLECLDDEEERKDLIDSIAEAIRIRQKLSKIIGNVYYPNFIKKEL